MSAHSHLYISEYEIDYYQNDLPGWLGVLFTSADKVASTEPYPPEEDDEDDERTSREYYRYETTAKVAIQRLEVAGYSLRLAAEHFRVGAAHYLSVQENEQTAAGDGAAESVDVDWGDDFVLCSPHDGALRELYKNVDFEAWLGLLRIIVNRRLMPFYERRGEARERISEELQAIDSRLIPLLDQSYAYSEVTETQVQFGYPDADPLLLYRAALECVEPDERIVLEYTELVGWFGGEHPELAPPPRIVVLTEGTSDSRILKGTLEVLYPHLAEHYAFLDFEQVSMQGGAGQLLNTVRAFVGAGIQQRLVAVFDNDTAGREALRQLSQVTLPENIKAIPLPDLPSAATYPTIGPQGDLDADLNGRACSLELYLGRDILTGPDGELTKVQWTGYKKEMQRYQGEILDKRAVQERYIELLSGRGAPGMLDAHDWSGMELVWQCIFGLFG